MAVNPRMDHYATRNHIRDSLIINRAVCGSAPKPPEFSRREGDREECRHADHDDCPHEEEGRLRVGYATTRQSRSRHVNDRNAERKDRQDEDDDVTRTPFLNHQQRCIQPEGQKDDRNEVRKLSRGQAADDVVRMMK
jgi:hypothetical protein